MVGWLDEDTGREGRGAYFAEAAEDFDDVLCFQSDGHGSIQRVFTQSVFMDECRTAARTWVNRGTPRGKPSNAHREMGSAIATKKS